MREVGYSFTTRCLYRNGHRPGWIVKYGWKKELSGYTGRNPSSSEGVRSADAQRDTLPTGRVSAPISNDASFEAFLRSTSPSFTWDWPYQKYLYKKLNDVTTGKTKRLMIFMPPRHGKSELVTVRYTAWRLSQDPTLNVIVGSYNQKLANRFSRKIKNCTSSIQDSRYHLR